MTIHVAKPCLVYASILLFSLELNVSDGLLLFNATEIFLLEPKGRVKGGRSLGLFHCLIISTAHTVKSKTVRI
jgi:hypothetical protein